MNRMSTDLMRWLSPSKWTLREKVLLPAAALAILAAGLANGLAAWRLYHVVHEDQRSLGLSLAKALAGNAQELLLNRDASSIQGLVDEYRGNKNLSYVYLVSEKGKILVHTFTPTFPAGLELLNQPEKNSGEPSEKKLTVQGFERLDVAMPVLAGSLGVAHVGLDLEKATQQNWVMTAGNFVALLIFLAFGLTWLWKKVSKTLEPLQRLVTAAEAVEKEGDLRWRSVARGDDEIGRLGLAFERMLKRLAEIPVGLSGQVALLEGSVQALKRDHLAQGAIIESQVSALAQTQVTSEEVRQTSRQAAAQANEMIKEAAKARDLSKSGGEALSRSLDSLLTIRSRVQLLAADVESLEGRARKIEGIIDTVKDLADQSNLLALNAAIEAMRAGASGQGFGLVAREIRALADQSIAATEQVRMVLGDLNDGVRDAVKASREGVHDIEKGLERVQGSSETLADIQTTVGESVGQLQRIAAVVQQQDTGLSQVFLALQDQSKRMLESEQQQKRTAEAVHQLDDVARSVASVVQSFKV